MADTPRPKNPNAWLLAFRKYHTWLGLAMLAFILLVALTGIYLNHKDLFKGWGGPEVRKDPEKPEKTSHESTSLTRLTTATDLSALPLTFSQALALCHERLGDEPIERIELKNEKGRLVYKVKAASGELIIDADSGEATTKASSGGKNPRAKSIPFVRTAEEFEQEQHRAGTDWGKILKDLHTGKIGGLAGKLLIDLTAVVLIVLSLTGVYLWIVPLLRKQRAAQKRAATAPVQRPEAATPG